ncbi:MAG: T9SS type A sorting domain-containing protein, partial [Calditrichaeota bacterium]|nr:T9SS type A sorting domain-containing protein [Calditrichota bacterium]
NDPAQREFVVEITLQVTGLPIIEVEWSQEAGYPDSIDWNGVYDELFTGRDQPLRIEIKNAGTDELIIEDISFDHEYFSSEQQELIVPPFDSRMLTLIISAEEDGEHEGILTILSNDPENAEWEIQVHGITSSTPVMELNPDEFDVALIEGESTEFEVIIANIGEALLSWGSVSEIVEEPEQDGDTRSIRHIRPKSIGPNRDPLENGAFEDLQFACFTTNDNWGWIGDGMRQDPLLNEDNFVSYRGANDLAEVDYWDYDGVVITLYNQQFMNQYNANLERLTDYIYDGGGAYFETGRVQRHQTPGGLSNDQNDRSDNGIFLVSPNPEDENYSLFARILHISEPDYWLEGEVIEGDAWLNSSYSHGQFERAVRNGDIDWFQPVASTQNDPDRWGAVTYGIGTGIILTVGHPPGDCWFNWAENGGQWGSIGAEILYYISRTTAQWLSWNPKQGEIPPGQNDRIIVTLETEGMRHGVYEANINLYSNDPVAPEGEPDQTVSIALEITGIGRIFVEPAGPEDNEPYDFGIGYIGFPKAAEFKITNVGTGVLTIEEAVTDNEVFYVDEEIEFPIILEINEELLINVLFNSREEVENQEATIVFVTDPPHFEWNDGYPINVTGDGFEPPFINVFPDDISGDFIDGDLAEFVLNVSNEGSNLLIWDTEFEALERPNRDNPQRTVRRIEDSSGPRRDNPGDILAQFNSGILSCGCMTSTHDGLVYGCAYRNNRIIGMNIENGRIVSNWEGPGAPMAITWTGEEFWIVERPNSVVSRFNIEGEMIGEFDLNMQSIQGLACDLENTVYALSITEDSIFLIDIETHDQMGAILYREALGNSFLNDIECVPNHDEGKLWAYNRGNVIQMAISEELIPRVVSEIDVPGEENWAGLGHDGEDLWVGMWETEIWYKIEDGIDEWELIECDPAFGELEEGADIDVIATISIEEFPDGFYDGTLFFISNDPETPQVEISVRVSINGHPIITAEPVIPEPIVDEEEATIEFGDTFVDFEDSEFEIAILNIGDISLEIEEIVIDGEDAGAFTHNFEEEIEIPAREELEFILTFSPDAAGQKNATLILLTDAINVEDGIIWWNLTGLGQIVPDLENYVLPFDMEDAPDARHRLSVVELLWDNEHVPAGWEIGVFTETEELGGSAVWLGGGAVEFFAFGSEGDFAGFENGGRFSFKVWDNEADEDFEVGTTVRDGPETWEDGGETTLELDGGEITQLELELQESWNLISINVDPRQFYGDDEERGPSVPLMFEQLEDEDGNQPIELLKDELGHFWVPEWNFKNIDFWHLTQGYQICLTEEAEAVFQGRRIAPDAEISIKPGWNFIAYFPEFDLDASAPDFYVLSPIIDSVIRAKDGQGRFMSIEFQFSNMVPWTQGRGYHVNIDAEEPIVLIYPPEQDVAAVFGLDDYLENNISPVPSTRNMSILINSIDGVEPQVGDLISAYSSLGSKIGSGEFTSKRCGLAVWGDEENTEVIEGALKDEEIVLKFWDADKSVERNINVMSVLAGNGLTFESNGFIAIDVEVQTVVPENYYLSQNYPNPFNSTTRLTFGSPENAYVSVNVFDMNGRHFMELVNGTVEAGNHTVNWDAIDVSAGIYLVQMEASTGFRSIVKVILIK